MLKEKIASLKAFLNYLEFEDIISVNPFRKIRFKLKIPLKLPNVLSLKEVKQILTCAYKELGKINDKHTYKYISVTRDIAIIELLFGTGIRISELCKLHFRSVDIKNKVIQVDGKGAKQRFVHLCNNEIINALKRYDNILSNDEREAYFINRLNRPISDQSVRYMIRKYARLSKIHKNVTPHTFRHTFATLLLEEGVDIKYIQHFLGHSSIATTQIYTHVNRRSQKKILNSKHPRKYFSIFE